MRPFADSPSDVQVFGDQSVNAGIGTLLRPIATPLTLGGFDPGVIDPVASRVPRSGLRAGAWPARRSWRSRSRNRRDRARRAAAARRSDRRRADERRPRARRHRHGHRGRRRPRLRVRPPVLRPRPDAVPDDARLRAHACCRASPSSQKIASTGEVIGTVQQDRATTIAGTLGPGPSHDSRSR